MIKDSSSIIVDMTNSYISTIHQFIESFLKISFELSTEQYDCMLYVGINLIYRVYKYGLLKFNNIKTAEYYSQKAHVFFIEYMEQIYNHELSFNLNHNDAILFIYRKTIFEFHDIDSKQGDNKVVNIFSLQQPNTDIPDINICAYHLQQMHIFVNQIVQWKSSTLTTTNRIYICKHYLQIILKYTDYTDITINYLEHIYNITNISFSKYCKLIEEIGCYLLASKQYNHQLNKNEILLMKFYTESSYIQEKIDNNQIKELVSWLYAPTIL
jgi:hypothetical protein